MIDIYTIKLTEYAFERVLSGKKTVHLEINDKHHKVLAVGNQLTFVFETEDEKKEQKVIVENLLYFGDIIEAIETMGKEACGFRPGFTFEKASDIFMSGEEYENIEKNGIVAIVFKNVE